MTIYLDRHVYLSGYRGSGKTTVAGLLAEHLNVTWNDVDALIEKQSERSIPEIFSSDGEQAFRDLETHALQAISIESPRVIALGGGAILRETNRQILSDTGITFWLDVAPETLAARIAQDAMTTNQRPSLTGKSVEAEVRDVLAERLPLYRQSANYRINATQLTPDETAQEIVNTLQNANRQGSAHD